MHYFPNVVLVVGRQCSKKKGGSLRNRPCYHHFVRGAWPPESPAKSYLKVSCTSASALIHKLVAQRRRRDDSEALKYTAYCQSFRPFLRVSGRRHQEKLQKRYRRERAPCALHDSVPLRAGPCRDTTRAPACPFSATGSYQHLLPPPEFPLRPVCVRVKLPHEVSLAA